MTATVCVPSKMETDGGMESGAPPIKFFYSHLHESIRTEMDSLAQLVLGLESGSQEDVLKGLESVEERCRFLEQIYKYHSVAEDEVVYPALDSKVKNVTLQYSVEHADEEHLFEQLLQMLKESFWQSSPKLSSYVRDLVCKVEEVRITIQKHLAKEEEQLFPLLLEHFSYTEQAELVAQFLCCIPLAAMEQVLLWLMPQIPQEEKDQLIDYIRRAIPDDLLLQLLVTWLAPHKSPASCQLPQVGTPLPETLGHPPLNQIVHVHRSIGNALMQFVRDAQSLNFGNFNSGKLSSLVEKHRFLRAVCKFHMLSEEEVMFRELNLRNLTGGCMVECQAEHVEESVWFEDLGRLLADVQSTARRGAKEAYALLKQVIECAELVRANLGQHMEREEAELFPLLQENLCTAEQCIIVWRTVRMMPLRLLERVMPWLACRLSSKDAEELLAALRIGAGGSDTAAVELLARWVQRGCSPEPPDPERADDLSLYPNDTCEPKIVKESMSGEESDYSRKRRKLTGEGRSDALDVDVDVESEAGPSGLTGACGPSPVFRPVCPGPSPIDHIFQFHRALKKDFRLFETEASELVHLVENGEGNWEQAVKKLDGRFRFLWGIYTAHSRTEDEVVFPALESKEALRNICHSYMLDHIQEEAYFEDMEKTISRMRETSDLDSIRALAKEFHRKCAGVRATLDTHIRAEETELWPLFAEHFTFEEQHRLVGAIIGRTGAEVLQTMLPWVSGFFTNEEQEAMMESIRTATRNTMFDQWLDAVGGPVVTNSDKALQSTMTYPKSPEDVQAPLEEVAKYLRARGLYGSGAPEDSGSVSETSSFRPSWEDIFRMNQKQLEAAVRRVSSDDSLEPSRKTYIIQWIMVSKYIVAQQRQRHAVGKGARNGYKTYFNAEQGILGCTHYRRNCALVAACCGRTFTCRRCHDYECDHQMDRYKVEEMVCMKCGTQQPVAKHCSSCKSEMARYFCSICRLFNDDPDIEIYHCPFCNICRQGKGLGIDAVHCMECNHCMSTEEFNRHECRVKCMEVACPICHETLFDSSEPIKKLPCMHFLHSKCFAAYTRWNYTCPICSKSMGDMSVYFQMLDSLLGSDPMPPELKNMTQKVMCNDCGQTGDASYHYVYHACPFCKSYNTRVL